MLATLATLPAVKIAPQGADDDGIRRDYANADKAVAAALDGYADNPGFRTALSNYVLTVHANGTPNVTAISTEWLLTDGGYRPMAATAPAQKGQSTVRRAQEHFEVARKEAAAPAVDVKAVHDFVGESSTIVFALGALHDKLEDFVMGAGDLGEQGMFEAMRTCIRSADDKLGQALAILDGHQPATPSAPAAMAAKAKAPIDAGRRAALVERLPVMLLAVIQALRSDAGDNPATYELASVALEAAQELQGLEVSHA